MKTLLASCLGVIAIGCATSDRAGGDWNAPVIGGTPTPEGMFPATGALVSGPGKFFCTGTLISPEVVITAAHCLVSDVGTANFTLARDAINSTAEQIHAGRSMHPHPQFDYSSEPAPGVGMWFDIGVLLLSEPVYGVAYERLPSAIEAVELLARGTSVDLVGYGATDPDWWLDGGIKMHGTATLVEVGSYELLIAIPGEQQNCFGDSGGPAFATLPGGDRRMVGIVSRSPDSNSRCDHGGIDSRVDAYREFIDGVLAEQGVEIPDADGPDASAPNR